MPFTMKCRKCAGGISSLRRCGIVSPPRNHRMAIETARHGASLEGDGIAAIGGQQERALALDDFVGESHGNEQF